MSKVTLSRDQFASNEPRRGFSNLLSSDFITLCNLSCTKSIRSRYDPNFWLSPPVICKKKRFGNIYFLSWVFFRVWARQEMDSIPDNILTKQQNIFMFAVMDPHSVYLQ